MRLVRLLGVVALPCLFGCFLGMSTSAFAAQVPLTIIHTNDLHSHYQVDKGPFGLGGIARVATMVRRLRNSSENSLLLDGGDWSEGNVYYKLDAGRTSLEMLNALKYDAVVIGNHDWLNGPDHLLGLFREAAPHYGILAANLDLSRYSRASEFSRYVQPYQILKAGPLKIAVIGLVTFEKIYDRYFEPIGITDPFGVTRRLAAKLKSEQAADLVVVISHNSLPTNKFVANLPNVDIVIHSHDHEKFAQPLEVEHNGKKAILVEAGLWGFYVGKLDILFDTESKKYSVKDYKLIQIDENTPEDPEIATMVANYDRQIEQTEGDIFHDYLAETQIDLRRETNESLYGNLLTDAYREATGADISFEQISLTSGSIHKGPLHTADIFNALTAVYNPITGKAWTLKTMTITGSTLSWVMNLVLSIASYVPGGMISVSGMHAIFDPMTLRNIDIYEDAKRKPLRLLEINGAPVSAKKHYTVAMPQGIYESVEFIENFFGNKIERFNVKDTGIEDWVALRDYLKKHSPIDSSVVSRGGRISVLQADLGLYQDDVFVTRRGREIHAKINLRNLGTTASLPRHIKMTYDQTPDYTGDDPNPVASQVSFDVPAILPGKRALVEARLVLPREFKKKKMPIYLELDHVPSDPDRTNDGTWLLVQ